MSLIRHPNPNHAQIERAITIGNFDGVHRGHTAILDALVAEANKLKLRPSVITFAPNPKAYFAAQHNKPEPTRVQPLRDKVACLKHHGIDDIMVMPFNQALANMPAIDFIEKILIQSLNAKHLLVGDDFRFGAARSGNFQLLSEKASIYGYSLQSHGSVMHEQARISSTAVRNAIADGDMALTNSLLGHDYVLSGHIIYGQQLGRTIGFPTINIKMPDNLAAQGIFAVQVIIDGITHQGVASIGTRPSVKSNGQCWLEVYILDFNQSVYGKIAHVRVMHKIRNEEKFDGLDSLTHAIHNDIQVARDYFSANPN